GVGGGGGGGQERSEGGRDAVRRRPWGRAVRPADHRGEEEKIGRIDLEDPPHREGPDVDGSREAPFGQEQPHDQVAAEGEEQVDARPAAALPDLAYRVAPGPGGDLGGMHAEHGQDGRRAKDIERTRAPGPGHASLPYPAAVPRAITPAQQLRSIISNRRSPSSVRK